MPGILPMKVIKVGGNTQSRVAQACDRCRSKKIRCDGVRPCCSQCANVGFECKTSDKLSRRAFPRGYTESLEDRVRALEAETRELKCLLDEKDEKIDVLSRLHDMSPNARKASPPVTTRHSPISSPTQDAQAQPMAERDDVIHVHHSSSLLRKPTEDTPFTGPSSTRAFVDAFAHKLEAGGRSTSAISTDALLSTTPSPYTQQRRDSAPKTPPRLVSDQLLNIFFQEWAPLYPVVHRPAILKLYGQYVTNPESIDDSQYAVAQLNLIFGIAAASSTSRVPQDPLLFEANWESTLAAISTEISLPALQCYILAQIYYSVKSDYKSVLRYRGMAVAICLQLGLHQSQRRFSFSPLMNETRKRVFWCQYTLDRFAAALTGLPVLISESDICTEYPADVDDDYVTETGFVSTQRDEPTRMSSALALFDASRILTKVLNELYPSPAGYNVSLSSIHTLAEELDEWQRQLPSHLRLDFAHDKPSDNITGSCSPLLSIAYYFIRTLIRRPAVCFGQPETSSPSLLSLVDSAKHTIQLFKLLEERRMSHALSVNKRELILIAGLGLLWQNVDLNPDSKLVKEGQKMLTSAFTLLESEAAEVAAEFSTLVNVVSPTEEVRRPSAESFTSGQSVSRQKSPPKKLQARLPLSTQNGDISPGPRSAPMTASTPDLRSVKRSPSSHSTRSDRCFQNPSVPQPSNGQNSPSGYLKLDYLPLGNGKSDWEHVLTDMENGQTNIYNGIYGGSECGEVTASFPGMNGTPQIYTPHLQAPQRRDPSQHHQHPTSLPTLQTGPSVADARSGSIHSWPSESWSATVASGMHPVPDPQSAISYSEDGVGNLSPGGMMPNGHHHHPHPHPHHPQHTQHPQHPQHQRHRDPHSAGGLDPIDALMVPATLDSLDGTADFNMSDGTWMSQCVM